METKRKGGKKRERKKLSPTMKFKIVNAKYIGEGGDWRKITGVTRKTVLALP